VIKETQDFIQYLTLFIFSLSLFPSGGALFLSSWQYPEGQRSEVSCHSELY